MSQVFHDIEKKIITSLRDNPKQTPESLEKSTQLSPDQIRRGIEWLKLKDLAIVFKSKSSVMSLGKNGIESFEKGLPERRLLNLLKDGPRKLSDLQKELGFVFGPSMGLARKNNWVEASSDQISIKNPPSDLPGEKTLKLIGNKKLSKDKIDSVDLSGFLKRPDFIVEDVIKTKEISLSDTAKSIKISDSVGGIDVEAKPIDGPKSFSNLLISKTVLGNSFVKTDVKFSKRWSYLFIGILPFFAANSSLVIPMITLSEISNAFDSKVRCPLWIISKVPPIATRENLDM